MEGGPLVYEKNRGICWIKIATILVSRWEVFLDSRNRKLFSGLKRDSVFVTNEESACIRRG